jgi:hypothetical protein
MSGKGGVMTDRVFLVVSPDRVVRMNKQMPEVNRDEIIVPLTVKVERSAFRSPTVAREIYVADPLEGVNLDQDVELRKDVITQAEAELIIQRRLRRMTEIITEHGGKVEWPEEEPGD